MGGSEGRLHSTSRQIPEVTDMGAAKISHRSELMTTGRGTPLWMAPEIIRTMKQHGSMAHFSQAVDTYAFGIIMWETLERLEPWSNLGFKWSHEILDAVCD